MRSRPILFAMAVLTLLAACARAETPEQHVIVITASAVPADLAAATFTPFAPNQTPSPVLALITPLPVCSSTVTGPCRLVTETPLPPSATFAPASTFTPTFTPTSPFTATPEATATPLLTAIPARSLDAPTISEGTVTLKAYSWQEHLVYTQPGDRIYPYPRIDYDPFVFDPGLPAPQTYKTVILENNYVSLTFLPEFGGRLYRWFDKTTNRQLLYNNPVIKATAYGVRGWWLSIGGLEWGLPVEDHGYVEWVPWTYNTLTTSDTAAVIVSVQDEHTNLECAIRIELDSTHNYFTLTPFLHNPNPAPLSYQFWMAAIAAPAGDNKSGPDLRFNVPASSMLIHSTEDKLLPGDGQTITWPVYNGRDLSLYGNWTKFLSLFAVPNATQPYVGLYTPRASGGFVRIFPPDVVRGIKLFAPGDLPPFVWTTNDGDSSYIELWGGLTTNFAENTILQPDDSLTWTEYWYPFNNIGNYVWANKDVALAVDDVATDVTVKLYLTSAQTVSVALFVNNNPVAQWPAVTTAPGPWQNTWPRTTNGSIGIVLSDLSGTVITRFGQTP